MKIKFQQSWVKPKYSIDEKTKLLPILYQFHHQNLNVGMYFYLSAIISRKKFALLSKPVFNTISRRNHSFLINTVTKKIKYLPQLLTLRPQIALKRRWHCFLFWSIITTKLDIYVCKYKDDYMIIFSRVYCKLSAWSQ